MANRIEVAQIVPDARAEVKKRELEAIGFSGKVDNVELVDVYTIEEDLSKEVSMLYELGLEDYEIEYILYLKTKEIARLKWGH